MTTPITHNASPKTAQDFSNFEKEALEASSLHDLKLDLQRYLNRLHREQKEDIAERISTIEKRCNEEVRATLEKHVKLQLEKHFQQTLKSLQSEVMKLFSPLLNSSEEDVRRLHAAVNKTNGLCQVGVFLVKRKRKRI